MEVEEFINNILSLDKRQKFIYSLYYYEEKKVFFVSDLERYFNYKYPQQDIRKVVSSLIKLGVFENVEKERGDWSLRLNKKKLKSLIRESNLFMENGLFIESCKPNTYNY